MDFLNKSMQQIGDLLKSMSPAARVTAGLLLAVVVISMVYLFRYQGTSPNNYLLAARSFSSNELSAMQAAFSQAGLNDYEIEGSKVRVPLSQRAAYLAALAEYNALPQNFESVLAEALSTNSPFESQTARTQRVQYAKQRELSRVISSMNGIENASVYYDELTERGLRGTRKFTAAVSVQPIGSGSLDTKLVDSIRKFVAASQAGMRPEDVTVTDLISGRTYSMPTDPTAQRAGQYADTKLHLEQAWQEKIARILGYIEGVEVGVNVELKELVESESYNVTPEAKVTPFWSSEDSLVERTSSGAGGGQPGVVPNVGQANQSTQLAAQNQNTSEVERRRGNQLNFPGGSVVRQVDAPLTPQKVTVSVAVPTTYYEDLWRRNNPAAPGEEQALPEDGALQQLEEEVKTRVEYQVAALLPPVPGGENVYEPVTVTSFTRITAPPLAEPGIAVTVWEWFSDHGSQVAMMVAGLFGLLVLRGVVRGGGSSPAPVDDHHAMENPMRIHEEHHDDEEVDPEHPVSPKKKRKFAAGGPSLRDELADMVREDPDTAANILKSWISDAA